MVIRLDKDLGKLVMVAGKGVGGWGKWKGGLLGFVALVCVRVYFHCCGGGCLCQ
jgi:hypothetical protein